VRRLALALALLIAAPLLFAEDTVQLNLHETITLRVVSVTAAYALDAAVAEASVHGGELLVWGRGPGETQLVLVTPLGTRTMRIVVRSPLAPVTPQQSSHVGGGVVESRYTSSIGQIQSAVEMAKKTAERETRLQATVVNRLGARRTDEGAAALPSISISTKTARREITLLDRPVDNSPLTMESTVLRGFHILDGAWAVHAGVTAAGFLDRFILPVKRENVAGASYALRLSPSSTVKPSFFVMRDGSVASVLYQYAHGDDLLTRGEIGYSNGSAGGAFEFASSRPHDRFRANALYRPRDFATAGPFDERGFYSDVAWSSERGERFSAAASASLNHPTLTHYEQRSVTSNSEVRFRATRSLTFFGGASYGAFQAIVPAGARIRSITVPVGVSADFARGGVSALVRAGSNSGSGTSRGFRVTGRASLGGFRANAWLDRQSDVPTLSVIFRERPDLALALEELGITAATPADIARLLRDEAPLIEHGFVESAVINLAPLRTQAGVEMSWFGSSQSRQQLRARFLYNRIDGVASSTTSSIASLTYARRLTGSTRIEASYALWLTESRGNHVRTPSVEIALRHEFDGVPDFGARGVVRGLVFADDDITGVSTGQGISDVEVALDGSQRTRTDAAGRFSFSSVGSRMHRVIAQLPSADSYFTTASHVEASVGDVVAFGVARTPARLIGHVMSDAGAGVSAVGVTLSRGSTRHASSSDSEGRFEIVAPPGEWEASIVRDSLPAGYAVADASARNVMLKRAEPVTSDFTVRAARSISGRLAAPGEVIVQPGGRRVMSDSDGHYAIRSLPAGKVTLVAAGQSRSMVLPAEPASIHDVDFGVVLVPMISAAAPAADAPRPAGQWIVQLGAFRDPANVADALRRASAAGIDAVARQGARLTFVQAGPFASRSDAERLRAIATRGGLEAVIAMSR
jgi:hypothetical protein